MATFTLDRDGLQRLLSDCFGEPVVLASITELGESSRETPWRVDFERKGRVESALLRYGKGCSRNEVMALWAMESTSIPAPRVLLWDEAGDALGIPVFLSEFINGEPLLPAMKRQETWAIDLYLDTACEVQDIQEGDLPQGTADTLEVGESATDVLNAAYEMIETKDALVVSAYQRLREMQPDLPSPQFSNGDLWPENLLVQDQKLQGIIDWQHAGFSDPIFEFLLPFFLVPELRGLGIEERFCERKGFGPEVLHWYHGLEFFDSLRWVLKTGKPYEMHTADSLREDLNVWLEKG